MEQQDELTLDTQEEQQESSEENSTESSAEEALAKARAEAAKWRRIAEKKSQPKTITNQQEIPKPSDILKADEFKLYRQGYNESEIDLIMHNGGAKILEDKTNPLVLGLQASKEQRTAEEAAYKVSDSSGLSDIERKFTESDLRNMTKEELEKLLPKTE